MNSKIQQRAFTTMAATLLIGGVSLGSASVATAAEGDLSAFGDIKDIAQVDANVNLNNNDSILDATADVNVNLGDQSVASPVTGTLNQVTADANVNLLNPSQVSPSQPLTSAYADVYLGSPSVGQALPATPVAPAPATAPLSAPAAEVSVALNAATNTADGILANFTDANQGGLTGSLVDGAANIRIGNLQPGQQYDFVLFSDSDAQTEPTLLGTYTADATGVVLVALPAGLVNSGDGSGEGLLNADGDAVGDATGIGAADSLLRIAVLPGGLATGGNGSGTGDEAGDGGITVGGIAEDGFGVLDGMVGWVDPTTGNGSTDGNSGSDGTADNGGVVAGTDGNGNAGTNGNGTTGVLQNNGNAVPASGTLANMSTGVSPVTATEAAGTRSFLDNLANTGAQNMGTLLPIGGLLIAAGSALFFYRRKLGLTT